LSINKTTQNYILRRMKSPTAIIGHEEDDREEDEEKEEEEEEDQ